MKSALITLTNLAFTLLLAASNAQAADWNKPAFETKSLDATIKALGGNGSTVSKDISWGSTVELVENGAVVPITVATTLPNVESMAILVEKNPNALAANFDIPAGTDSFITTRIKMTESSKVYALVKADGKYYTAMKEIKVTIGGCGGTVNAPENDMSIKPDPMKINAKQKGGTVEVRTSIPHEMETGLRKDVNEKIVPAHFIQQISATANGKTVLSAQWGTAISKNPSLAFKFKGSAGDKLQVTWTDNKGATRTDEVVVN